MWPILFSVVFVASILYLLLVIRFGYWKRRGVPGPTPGLLGGNIGGLFKKNLAEVYADIHHKYGRYPFIGIYKFFTPALLVRDPDVIKEVIVKEFSSFYDNTITFDEHDPFIGRNPFVLNGEKWKAARTKLTPLFTSTKVKSLIGTFGSGGQKLVDYIKKNGGKDLDAKDLAIRFSAENVASYALGVEAECFEEHDSEFRKISKDLFKANSLQIIVAVLAVVFPSLTKIFRLRLTTPSVEKRFKSLVESTIKYRIENNVDRNDYLSALIKIKNTGAFSEHDILVSIGALFIDGIESSACALAFFLYELAAHPWVQEELKREIDEVLAKHDGVVTYEALQEMKYLDASFNENLRLHPVVPFMDRQTTQKTKLSGSTSDGKHIGVELEVGTPVVMSILALHQEEKYFPDPASFKPERFLAESRDDFHKFAFLPFGEGPRKCLGTIFGTFQVKVGVVQVVRNYKVALGSKVPYPVGVSPESFILTPKEPIGLKFQPWQ